MSTYRTGNHWGVTIVREQPEPAQLVAVVVNGDQALAERICTLLNGAMRQVAATAALDQAATDMRKGYPGHGYPIEYVNGWEDAADFAEGFASGDAPPDHGHEHPPGTPPHSHRPGPVS